MGEKAGRQRRGRRGLVERFVGIAGTVETAGGGKDEAFHARRLGQAGDIDRGPEVDVVGQFRINRAQGVVAERAQVDNGIEAGNILCRDIAQVAVNGRHVLTDGNKIAAAIVVGVQSDHIMARLAQYPGHDDADVAAMAGNKNTHRFATPHFFSGHRKHPSGSSQAADPRQSVRKRTCVRRIPPRSRKAHSIPRRVCASARGRFPH